MYNVYSRRWWKDNTSGDWPNNLEPHLGRKNYIRKGVETEAEAVQICKEWNRENPEGRYSIRAEFEKE